MPIVAIVPSGSQECRAIPPRVHVDAGDQLSWINLTGDEITIFFPGAASVFVAPPANGLMPGIAHNANPVGAPFAVRARGAGAGAGLRNGRYPYSVYCKLTNSYAEGDSSPEVEVP